MVLAKPACHFRSGQSARAKKNYSSLWYVLILIFPIELTERVVAISNETTAIVTNRTVLLGNKVCMSW